MTAPIAALARAVAAGDLDACPVLADALEEAGRAGAARRLRLRHRRWEHRRLRLIGETNAWLADTRRSLEDLKRTVENAGGTMTFAVEAYELGRRGGPLLLHEDALLRAFVARLLAEEGLWKR